MSQPGSIAASLLPAWDMEWPNTRKLIEVAPHAKASWKPHPKSMSLGDLVTHLANIPTWVAGTLKATELDVAPPGGPAWTPPKYTSIAETLRTFDRNVAEARACIAATSDAEFARSWTLKKGGAVVFTMPRTACIRTFVLSHMIHHRGQLSVYLRLCDVVLPSVYGPTADVGL